MTDAALAERTVFLSNLPAGRDECRFAGAIIVVSTVIFLALAPFAKVPLGPLPAFIPIYQSALLINDLITVVFLLGLGRLSNSNALNLLAGGYLFTALISAAHALTFPGLFSPTGLLGAGSQTTAWLYTFWHGGFPLFVIAYARSGLAEQPSRRFGASFAGIAVLVCGAVVSLTLVTTFGQNFLPAIMQGNHYAPALIIVIASVWILNLLALLILLRPRSYTVLNLWLIVAMCAWLFEIALSAMFNAGRYDVGFYAGRVYGLLAASFVLVVLLLEHGRLYIQLHKLHESEREKSTELRRLSTIDPLTGIANRRAFEDALDQEWRRMMRHATALSLLMVDVDYFKRFNDTYGHVAGDQCIRAVAQTLASRARRAGEMAARYGGEEFAVLLPHSDVKDASKLAELICDSMREQRIPHEGSAVASYVTVSIGVASIAEVPQSAATLSRDGIALATSHGAVVLIEAADQALYQAKTAGRNRFVVVGNDDIAPATGLGAAASYTSSAA